MTFEERVQALARWRFTERQTRFLALVALHSGFCVRRQYGTFARVDPAGKNVRAFFEELVVRDLARRRRFRVDRGQVYHLHAKAVYRAIGQDENRNRRHASPALIARKLMLLDVVLTQPDVEWMATEADKIDLFVTRFGVAAEDLPTHVSATDTGARHVRRYFWHKLPIGVTGSPPTPHFICLITESGTSALTSFLRDHRRLLRHLPHWTIVCTRPALLHNEDADRAAFDQFLERGAGDLPADGDELRRYFAARELIERGDLAQFSAADLHGYRALHQRLDTRTINRRYQVWRHDGDAALTDNRTVRSTGHGTLVCRTLEHSYEQFGSMAGVA